MPEAITIGETMVLFLPGQNKRLRHVTSFTKTVAGAESNVAVGLVRLGLTAGWISRVGDDEFGRTVLSSLRGEGVDVSQVVIDPDAPTGVFFRERTTPGQESVYYYRTGSAASRLSPDDLDPAYFRGARLLHISGITPALSDSAAAALHRAVAIAGAAGLLVSFDLNLRPQLWKGREIRPALLPLVAAADLVFGNEGEVDALLGAPRDRLGALLEAGCKMAVVKLGAQGAAAATAGERWVAPVARSGPIVDGSGAGDSFAAAFLAGHLRGETVPACLALANGMAQAALSCEGDIESLPRSLEELRSTWC
jgi:2-dehydro-3-deoxygluconokinase